MMRGSSPSKRGPVVQGKTKAEEQAAKEKKEAEKQARIAKVLAERAAMPPIEYRYGHPINPNPAVKLKVPPK